MQQKYQKKYTLQDFRGNIYSKNIKYKNSIFFFVFPIYKRGKYKNEMTAITKDEFDKLWLNERHIQIQLGLENLPALTKKYDKEYKKNRSELNESTSQSHRRFIHAD